VLLVKSSLISVETPGAAQLIQEINQILNDYTNTVFFTKSIISEPDTKKILDADADKFKKILRKKQMSVKVGKPYKGEIKSTDARKLMGIINAK